MYCKYCGGIVSADSGKCLSCGADINLNDGGQSFYDENELTLWQSDIERQSEMAPVPKTEMKETACEELPSAQIKTRNVSKKIKCRTEVVIEDSRPFKMSGSNKLILFCIASALAIVLLIVAIVAVLSPDNKTEDNTNENAGYSEQYSGYSEEASESENIENVSPQVTEREVDGRREISGAKIIGKNGEEVEHDVALFIDGDGVVFVSVERILKYENYKSGVVRDNRVNFDHKEVVRVLEIEKYTNVIWRSDDNKNLKSDKMESAIFENNGIIYAPVKGLLKMIDYDENKIVWVEEEKTLYLNKEK